MKYNSYTKVSNKHIFINALIFGLVLIVYKILNIKEYFLPNKYVKKHNKVCVVTHVDFGDTINQIGALRYLASIYDEVVLCIKNGTKDKLHDIINTLPHIESSTKPLNIVLYELNTKNIYDDINSVAQEIKQYENTHDIRYAGTFNKLNNAPETNFKITPFNYYNDLDVDISHFYNSSYIPKLPQSIELYNKVKDISYAFITTDTSSGELFDSELLETKLNIDKNITLILCSNKNVYTPEHKYYTLANEFVMKPFFWYVDTIKHAKYVVLSDSSMLCMSLHIPIETDECYVIPRIADSDYSYLWDSVYHYNPDSGKKVFKKI